VNVSYRDEPLTTSWGPVRKISTVLIATGALLLALVTVDQVRQALISKSYGIHVEWLGLLVALVLFSGLEIIAIFAARTKRYGVSIWCAAFVVWPLGLLVLMELAQVGM
jgi:hypothetical protein